MIPSAANSIPKKPNSFATKSAALVWAAANPTTSSSRTGASSVHPKKSCSGTAHGPTPNPPDHVSVPKHRAMNVNLTPRQILKRLLQGTPPPRPLFLPIVFSLGAKVENLPVRPFLCNATKITNSLRQIRTHLRSDGVACYFDPYLEAEALGATLQYAAEDQLPTMQWQHRDEIGELPEGLCSPEDAAKSPRVTVAIEVIQRLKSQMRD